MAHVEEYMSRFLSFGSDILNGFSAILTYMSEQYGLSFCFGLPISMFCEALSWYDFHENEEVPRRRRSANGNHQWPSWSWCGWYWSAGNFLIFRYTPANTGLRSEIG